MTTDHCRQGDARSMIPGLWDPEVKAFAERIRDSAVMMRGDAMSEQVLVVWATDMPGLCDGHIYDRGTREVVETFRDLTTGQIADISRQRMINVEWMDGKSWP